jgi:hypothetical protein
LRENDLRRRDLGIRDGNNREGAGDARERREGHDRRDDGRGGRRESREQSREVGEAKRREVGDASHAGSRDLGNTGFRDVGEMERKEAGEAGRREVSDVGRGDWGHRGNAGETGRRDDARRRDVAEMGRKDVADAGRRNTGGEVGSRENDGGYREGTGRSEAEQMGGRESGVRRDMTETTRRVERSQHEPLEQRRHRP